MRGLVAFFTVVALAITPLSAQAKAKEKHAVLLMDADTNAVMYEENGHDKRYPASLTKMMTLYMLFDALRKEQLDLSSRMRASKKAASQPQTNISLKKGDTISVEQAIKALVVRSANDVAVVVAEHLGRTEWNFGVMMTGKARALGLKNTVFRNPHGLPDNRQYTTAYDMALLGKALRRDFPQYYHYFETKKFSFKGKDFKSHNRVLGRFEGVDGIKTGYIRASGFNLVSSVKKDGFQVVAVVLGGKSSKARDNEMVELLERTWTKLETIKRRPRYIATAPKPAANPRRAEIERQVALAQQQKAAGITPSAAEKPAISVSFAGEEEQKRQAPSFSLRLNNSNDRGRPTPPRGTLDFQLANLDKQEKAASQQPKGRAWGIQIGAFQKEEQAQTAVKKAFKLVQKDVKQAYIAITSQGYPNPTIHRARLGNLTQGEANQACKKLIQMNESCFPLRIN